MTATPSPSTRADEIEKTLVERCATTNVLLSRDIDAHFQRLNFRIISEEEQRHKFDAALRAKDEAMSVLFQRLQAHGIDYSDLIP